MVQKPTSTEDLTNILQNIVTAREDQIFLVENSGVSAEEVYKQKISNSEGNRLSLQESVNYEGSNGTNAVEQNNDEQRQTNSTRVADDAARILERA